MANLIIQQESDIKNPLAFFEYFFKSGGYQKKLKEFHSHPEIVYDLVVDVSKKEDYIEYYHNNCEGIDYPRRDYFITGVEKQLKYQSLISYNLIDTNIDQKIQNGESIIPYLQRQFDRLIILHNTIKSSHVLSKHKESVICIDQLILNLATNYKSFLSEIKSQNILSFIETIESLKKEKTQIPDSLVAIDSTPTNNNKLNHKQAEIYSFKWVSFPEIYTIFLYGILTRNEVIEDSKENFILFELAFSGKPLLKPLKIKWKLPGHAGSIKTPIVRVIQVLMEELQLIVNIPEPMRFAKTIESIFVNDDGSEIKNVYQSKNKIAPTKNNSKEALLIDDIIKKFSSANSSVIPR